MHDKNYKYWIIIIVLCFWIQPAFAQRPMTLKEKKEEKRKQDIAAVQSKFQWWPSDAKPGMVEDLARGGYWWWPKEPGKIRPWGNRGYIYVYKIIYDYKAEEVTVEVELPKVETIVEVPKVEPVIAVPELKPSLLIKKIIKNVKIYFDYNKAQLREDHFDILDRAVKSLKRNQDASILITGNCDKRGSDEYNLKLGKARGENVKAYMIEKGVPEGRVLIVSRGKLDAIAPISDLAGMQKDRNAQFMIAEVEEILIPEMDKASLQEAIEIEEGKYTIEIKEKVETPAKVSTREYVIKKGDSLSGITQRELGAAHRWKYLYELNKDVITDPNKLKVGQRIIIPVE
ncbi:MAG: hypothetical protein A2Y03_02995 [Omnitrophica WOR_2 bacterium GWF2_38_59]|nr:MAG: hypothetical protein A2Y03_02995 [Omnitrophica WOR_2 bacterium GWF2_38_59]OGX48682.1 MAG: hypothetical protein A2243_09880 [Omnitrophica WOR_2 bacterium RIFOXYA2_FULL_38_17]OGX57200.1 MAG: hypothetical protein A2306_01720 [Omnitrophica WOR_2 bacterium RIFOXYB2_FULL_38_16]HBG61949.1 hypothetical protein [Candidatus Omnitrophota bacterium]